MEVLEFNPIQSEFLMLEACVKYAKVSGAPPVI